MEHGNSLIRLDITLRALSFSVHHDLKGDKKSIIIHIGISVVVQNFSLFLVCWRKFVE